MSVAAHLNITPAQYDAKIRTLIPLYDELLLHAAAALRLAPRKIARLVDLGVGTGALTRTCLDVVPSARVIGIDADISMAALVPARLGARSAQVKIMQGDFTRTALPACDALVGSYALHHIRTPRAKQSFYHRCYAALRPGGILVNGDCAPASSPSAFAADLEVWYAHLAQAFGRAKGKRVYASWADEDTYMPLATEVKMLQRAGFAVDIPWRRSPFAVIAAIKPQ